MLDSKAERIIHVPTSMGRWVASFPEFSVRIEWKLAQEVYSGLMLKISTFWSCWLQDYWDLLAVLRKIDLVHQGIKTQRLFKSVFIPGMSKSMD